MSPKITVYKRSPGKWLTLQNCRLEEPWCLMVHGFFVHNICIHQPAPAARAHQYQHHRALPPWYHRHAPVVPTVSVEGDFALPPGAWYDCTNGLSACRDPQTPETRDLEGTGPRDLGAAAEPHPLIHSRGNPLETIQLAIFNW